MNGLLMNYWYMGAWSGEVSDAPISRRLLGLGTMFFRKLDGAFAALRDRCTHRFAPLSRGKAVGDAFGVTHVDAHYKLETDNLMDLSHVDMLHPPFAGVLSRQSKFKVTREGNRIQADWISSRAASPTSMEYGPFPTNGGLIDHWLEMRWDLPGCMYLEVAVTKTGEPREAGYTMPGVHILTPETGTSTHYFWAGSLHVEDEVPMDHFRESFVQTFEHEDTPMIEAVAAAMDGETDLLAMKPLLLRSDAGSVLARRVMAELIAKERAGSIYVAAA